MLSCDRPRPRSSIDPFLITSPSPYQSQPVPLAPLPDRPDVHQKLRLGLGTGTAEHRAPQGRRRYHRGLAGFFARYGRPSGAGPGPPGLLSCTCPSCAFAAPRAGRDFLTALRGMIQRGIRNSCCRSGLSTTWPLHRAQPPRCERGSRPTWLAVARWQVNGIFWMLGLV